MDLADRLEGQYPKKTLSLMHGAVLPERSDSFADVLDYYAEFKQTGYGATDHRLKVRIAKQVALRGCARGRMDYGRGRLR